MPQASIDMLLILDSDQEKMDPLLSNHGVRLNRLLMWRPASGEARSLEFAAFFIIGGVINAVVLLLFALWARREWRRSRK